MTTNLLVVSGEIYDFVSLRHRFDHYYFVTSITLHGKTMKKSIISTAIAALVINAGFITVAKASDWGYEGQHGPEHWGNIASECSAGRNQSPINISEPVQANLAALEVNYPGEVTEMANNGHTLQAIVSGENILKVDGEEFRLLQFHFHTPSENQIKDERFPLEAHFVHQNSQGDLAVLSVMYRLDTQANPQLASLLASAPGAHKQVALPTPVALSDMLPSTDGYYRFNGSLTTPPCSEGVRWYVMKEASALSPQQVASFEHFMGHNNRPLQAIGARKVLQN